MPALWIDRFWAMEEAQRQAKPKEPNVGQSVTVGNVKKTRVI